ncbi:CGNR zinc finger domain-containing protein [Longispora urticae]
MRPAPGPTGGPGLHRRWEILHSPADLAAWLPHSRLALTAPLTSDDFLVDEAGLAAVRAFRDLWLPIAQALAPDEPDPLAPRDLERLNAAVSPPPRPRVDPATRALGWVTPVTAAEVLGAVAREAVALVADPTRLRECGAPDCRLLFLDTSRSANRRWCSMERCGNRNKVRNYRTRALS